MTVYKTRAGSVAVDRPGIYLPLRSFPNLAPALAAHASTLVEIPYFGDSTGFGSGGDGGPVRKLRDVALAAGLTNGGRGVASRSETASSSGESLNPLVGSTGTWSDDGNQFDFLSPDVSKSSVAGSTRTFTGRIPVGGGALRIFYTIIPNQTGRFTYAVDGGAAVTIDAATATGSLQASVGIIRVALAAGDHTVVLTNLANTAADMAGTTYQLRFATEWVGLTGLVFHKQAISGISTVSYFNYAVSGSATQTNVPGQVALGLTPGPGTNGADWGSVPATKPTARNVKAAIFALGINDQQGNTDETTIAQAVANVTEGFALFVRMCRAAAADPILVVPHLTYATKASLYSGRLRKAMTDTARSMGVPYLDYNVALGPINTGFALYTGGPHINQLGYDVEGQFVWDSIFAPLLAGAIT